MTVQISDQQAAEFRLEGLPLRGTMVSGEDEEEEDYKLWRFDLHCAVRSSFTNTFWALPLHCLPFVLYAIPKS